MENANSYEYLEKIKIAVIENLKKTAAVPSVQMQDIPRASMGVTDEQDDEMDDLDDDENKDVRMTQRQWEKKVSRQDEYEDSDDEDMAEANGVYKVNGRKSILDYQNPNAVADDMEVDSGVATPAPKASEAPVDNDDTVLEDVEAPASPPAAEAEPAADAAPQTEAEAAKIDGDGDVSMEEVEEKATETTIKTEEVDGAPISESARKKSLAPEVADPAVDIEAAKAKDGASPSPSGSAPKNGDQAAEPAETSVAEASGKTESEVATTQPV